MNSDIREAFNIGIEQESMRRDLLSAKLELSQALDKIKELLEVEKDFKILLNSMTISFEKDTFFTDGSQVALEVVKKYKELR